jgi:hypothetical protein
VWNPALKIFEDEIQLNEHGDLTPVGTEKCEEKIMNVANGHTVSSVDIQYATTSVFAEVKAVVWKFSDKTVAYTPSTLPKLTSSYTADLGG